MLKKFRIRASVMAKDEDEARNKLLLGEDLIEITIVEIFPIVNYTLKDPKDY